MSSIEKTLKKVLKPPRTRSRTEVLSQTENTSEECPGTTANLAPVEAAEPVTGLASEESGDAGNTGSINGVPVKNSKPTIEDNTKRINELTKLVENKFNTIINAISLQNNQSLNPPARAEVSTICNYNSQTNSTDPRRSHSATTDEAMFGDNPQIYPNTRRLHTIPPTTSETMSALPAPLIHSNTLSSNSVAKSCSIKKKPNSPCKSHTVK